MTDDPLALGQLMQAQGHFASAAHFYRQVGERHRRFSQSTANGGQVAGPDFLVIGAPRSGTSWLRRVLTRHPRVSMLSEEPRYFAHQLQLRQAPQSFIAQFADIAPAHVQKPILGAKSPMMLNIPEDRIELCSALFPGLKLICLSRDPIARAWSHIKLLKPQSLDLDFLSTKQAGAPLSEVLDFGRYGYHLSRWARHFAPEQFLIADLYQSGSDARRTIGEVCRFIGADGEIAVPDFHPTSSDSPPSALLTALQTAYEGERSDLDYLRRCLRNGDKLAGSVRGIADRSEASTSAALRVEIDVWREAVHG